MPIIFHYFAHTKPLPVYLADSLAQARLWNPRAPIYLLCAAAEFAQWPARARVLALNVLVRAIDELSSPYMAAWEAKKSTALKAGTSWLGGFERLFELQAFMEAHQLSDVIHIEGDNMVYTEFSRHREAMRRLFRRCAVMATGTYVYVGAVMYIRDADALGVMLEHALRWQQRPAGELELLIRDGVGKAGVIEEAEKRSEMVFFAYYARVFGNEYLASFPTIPYGDSAVGMHDFEDGVFDGSGYGFLCSIAWAGDHHFIGREMLYNGLSLEFARSFVNTSLMQPYVIVPGLAGRTPIYNLHIMSKNVIEFSSLDAALEGRTCVWRPGMKSSRGVPRYFESFAK